MSYHRNNALEGSFVTFRNVLYVSFSTVRIVGGQLNSNYTEYCLLAKKLKLTCKNERHFSISENCLFFFLLTKGRQ